MMNQNQVNDSTMHTMSLWMHLYAMNSNNDNENNNRTIERQCKRPKTTAHTTIQNHRKKRRSVSFNDHHTDCIVIDRIENKADVWYTPADYVLIQKDIRRAFHQRLNGTYQESDHCTFAGLEKHLRNELQRKIVQAQHEIAQQQLWRHQQCL